MSLPVNIISKSLHCSTFQDNTDSIWKKELATATTSAAALLTRLELDSHIKNIDQQSAFKCLVTDTFINKMEKGNINDPLLRQILPLSEENDLKIQQTGKVDPVGDIDATASPGLLHKYHGRALIISTGACAVHCRYCFRRFYPYQQASCTGSVLKDTLSYLNRHTEIDEIILSGGEPLVLGNEKLGSLIKSLESISHVQTLRIHTRLPVVLPARINAGLLELLKKSRFNIVMVIHANHANEIQKEEKIKLQQLHDADITLLNQSVLLKGINDDADTLITLSKCLFQCHTLPYYLHLLDSVKGAMHYMVSKKLAVNLHLQMEKKLPGYLVPKLVQEIAGKTSKTAIFRI